MCGGYEVIHPLCCWLEKRVKDLEKTKVHERQEALNEELEDLN